MNTVFLKIKLKSLAAEARIIRRQEKKTGGKWNGVREALYLHRTKDVRGEARATHLAYGFLRGRKLSEIENKFLTEPDWEKVERMVKKYGTGPVDNFVDWRSETLVASTPEFKVAVAEAIAN